MDLPVSGLYVNFGNGVRLPVQAVACAPSPVDMTVDTTTIRLEVEAARVTLPLGTIELTRTPPGAVASALQDAARAVDYRALCVKICRHASGEQAVQFSLEEFREALKLQAEADAATAAAIGERAKAWPELPADEVRAKLAAEVTARPVIPAPGVDYGRLLLKLLAVPGVLKEIGYTVGGPPFTNPERAELQRLTAEATK